jgi:hypothetical protein
VTEATPSHLFSILKHLLFYDAPPSCRVFLSYIRDTGSQQLFAAFSAVRFLNVEKIGKTFRTYIAVKQIIEYRLYIFIRYFVGSVTPITG